LVVLLFFNISFVYLFLTNLHFRFINFFILIFVPLVVLLFLILEF